MHGNASIALFVEFASITLCWCNKQKKVYKKGQGGSLTPRTCNTSEFRSSLKLDPQLY